jgi:hypothetical protein
MSKKTLAELLTVVMREGVFLEKLTISHIALIPDTDPARGAAASTNAALWASLLDFSFSRLNGQAMPLASSSPPLLHSLNLAGNGLGDAGVASLVQVLHRCSQQPQEERMLDTDSSTSAAEGAAGGAAAGGVVASSSALSLCSLRKLFLGDNGIGPAGSAAVASVLSGSMDGATGTTTTTTTTAGGTTGTTTSGSMDGAVSAPSAAHHPAPLQLEEVSLTGNADIGAVGAAALASAIAFNTRLLKLDLSRIDIGEAGLRALASAMDTNPFIQSLRVDTDGHDLQSKVQRNHDWESTPATRVTSHTRMMVEMHSAALKQKVHELEVRLRVYEQEGAAACESRP